MPHQAGSSPAAPSTVVPGASEPCVLPEDPSLDEALYASDPILALLGLPEWYLSMLGANTAQMAETIPQSDQAVRNLLALVRSNVTKLPALAPEDTATVSNALLALLVCINQSLIWETCEGVPASRDTASPPAVSLGAAFGLAHDVLRQSCAALVTPMSLRLAATELLMSIVKLADVRQAVTCQSPDSALSHRRGSSSEDDALSLMERQSFYSLMLSLLPTSHIPENVASGPTNADKSAAPKAKLQGLASNQDSQVLRAPPVVIHERALEVSQSQTIPQAVVRSVQVRTILVLSKEGRSIDACPNLLQHANNMLRETWADLSRLRCSLHSSADTYSASNHALRYDQMVQEERTFRSLLELSASVVRFNFLKLPLPAVQDALISVCKTAVPQAVCLASRGSPSVSKASLFSSAEVAPQRSLSPPAMRKERGSWGANSSHSSSLEQTSSHGTPVIGSTGSATAASPALRHRHSMLSSSKAGTVAPPPVSTANSNTKPSMSPDAAPQRHAPAHPRSALRPEEVALIFSLFEAAMVFGILPPATVEPVALCLCRCLGQDSLAPPKDSALLTKAYEIEDGLLTAHYGNLAVRAVIDSLVSIRTPLVDDDHLFELPLAIGGLRYLVHAAQHADKHSQSLTMPKPAAPGKTSRRTNLLVSLGLFAPALKRLASLEMVPVDLEMISFYRSILPTESSTRAQGTTDASESGRMAHAELRSLSPATISDWDIVLELFLLTNKRAQTLRQCSASGMPSNVQGITALSLPFASTQTKWLAPKVHADPEHPVVRGFLSLVNDCRFSSMSPSPLVPTSMPPVATVGKSSDMAEYAVPWSQGWADLLLDLLWSFPDADAERMVRYYCAHELVLPCYPYWIDHLKTLISSILYRTAPSPRSFGSEPAPKARALLIELLFDRVYPAVADFPEFLRPLIKEVVLPVAEQALLSDPDDLLVPKLLETLVTAGARLGILENAAFSGSNTLSTSSKQSQPDTFSESCQVFTSIRLLLKKLARQGKGPKEGRYVFCLHSNNHAEVPITVHAVLSLIAIFNRIVFTASWTPTMVSQSADSTLGSNEYMSSRQAVTSCKNAIALFRDIVDIIRGTVAQSEASAGAGLGKAPLEPRLVALQWTLRLRTDSQHRLYVIRDIDEFIEPHAQLIGRDRSVHIDLDDPAPRVGRSSERGWEDTPSRAGRDESRGRSRRERSTARTREGSRVRVKPSSDRENERTRLHWHLPQRIHFEAPPDGARSQVVKTFRPTKSSHGSDGAEQSLPLSTREGELLPASELLEAYLAILQSEEDWDLVSYVMAHLPHQLTNRYLFCGPRCDDELRRVGNLLVSHMPPENKLVTQALLPWHIKRADVTAIGYATVQALVGYRALFSPTQQDTMVLTFVHGIGLAEPAALACARGLALCALQLPQSFATVLPITLVALQQATPTIAMVVHVLELLILMAHSPVAYRTLGEEDYQRVFSIVSKAVTQRPSSIQALEDSAAQRTLGRYVAYQAHYALALFFNRIEPSDRIGYVQFVTEQLLAGKERGKSVSDQTLVLLDYITRATFANSRPYPTRSFINTTLFGSVLARDHRAGVATQRAGQEDRCISKTYVYPHSVISISALQQRRWCEVVIRRPSGTISFLIRVENEDSDPALRDPGFQDTPELLLANRSGGDRPIYHAPSLPSLPGWTVAAGRPRRLSLGGRPSPTSSLAFVAENSAGQLYIPPYKTSEDRKPARAKAKDVAGKEFGSRSKDNKEAHPPVSPYEPRPSGELDNVRRVIQDVLEPDGTHAADAESKRVAVNLISHRVLDPAFIEMNMSGYPDVDLDRLPVAVTPSNSLAMSALARLDTAPVVDSKSIAVLFVGPGQATSNEVLSNLYGSPAYARFVARMGSELVQLDTPEAKLQRTGGLNAHDHGRHMYMWHDDMTQVFFHVPTMMPNLSSRPHFANKLSPVRHDFVHIVWNESGQEYDFGLISSRHSKFSVNIVISPDGRGGVELGSACFEGNTKYCALTTALPSARTDHVSRSRHAPTGAGNAQFLTRRRWDSDFRRRAPDLCAYVGDQCAPDDFNFYAHLSRRGIPEQYVAVPSVRAGLMH